MTPTEIPAVVRSAQAGDEYAIEQLIAQYEPLVCRVARKYACAGVDFEDLQQAGRLGICRAIQLYDDREGAVFMTYASIWIRSNICRALSKGHLVSHTNRDNVNKLRRSREELGDFDGTKLDRRRVKLDELIARHRPIASLDVPMYESDDGHSPTWGECLPDEAPSPEETMLHDERLKALREAMCGMDARTVDILLRGDRTLEVVGRKYGKTRERIRQIEVQGVAELREKLACYA